jgi:hypothetical protein
MLGGKATKAWAEAVGVAVTFRIMCRVFRIICHPSTGLYGKDVQKGARVLPPWLSISLRVAHRISRRDAPIYTTAPRGRRHAQKRSPMDIASAVTLFIPFNADPIAPFRHARVHGGTAIATSCCRRTPSKPLREPPALQDWAINAPPRLHRFLARLPCDTRDNSPST